MKRRNVIAEMVNHEMWNVTPDKMRQQRKIEPISIRPWIRCYFMKKCVVFFALFSVWYVRACFSLRGFCLPFSHWIHSKFLLKSLSIARHLTIVSAIFDRLYDSQTMLVYHPSINCLRDNNNIFFFFFCDVGSMLLLLLVLLCIFFFHLLDSNWNIFSKIPEKEKKKSHCTMTVFIDEILHVFCNSCNIQSCLTAPCTNIFPFSPWQKIIPWDKKRERDRVAFLSSTFHWTLTALPPSARREENGQQFAPQKKSTRKKCVCAHVNRNNSEVACQEASSFSCHADHPIHIRISAIQHSFPSFRNGNAFFQ